ncbi:flagellar basal body-associated FliL family protein [Pararhodobacter oceanensis]|uniref:Flagellar basal body-associated protein FliL n=1 Tax=Pararhodobacter oceanensis TaxID=2172121 RepID=A0A2T8HS24_9RHOB|nr:flagellar basal body-associated FliL family protein [Pararhodobacter oceanensis]PVH28215.1 flagellar basal body-associated protein FliL [Pararhodobacter oceanensis]
MKKLLPILLLLVGLGAGAGLGFVMQPEADPDAVAGAHAPEDAADDATHGAGDAAGVVLAEAGSSPSATGHYAPAPANVQTVRFPNQFVVPLIDEGRVHALVVIAIALEMDARFDFSMMTHEPRLRAIFLQLFFDHANLGGFDGVFTSGESLLALRRSLREAARIEIGTEVSDVLITELVRQET